MIPLNDVTADDDVRIRTGIRELDRVLGGRDRARVSRPGGRRSGHRESPRFCCRYASGWRIRKKYCIFSGEESQAQIKLRGEPDGGIRIRAVSPVRDESGDDPGRDRKGEKPELVIIDSIQTMFRRGSIFRSGERVTGRSESTNIFHCSLQKVQLCIPIFYRRTCDKRRDSGRTESAGAHGEIRCCILRGTAMPSYRILRAVKNRFGSTNEIGVFEMAADRSGGSGKISSEYYAQRQARKNASGSVVACSMERVKADPDRDPGTCVPQQFRDAEADCCGYRL